MKRFIPSIFFVIFSGIFLFSCKQNKEIVPSSEFAPYISAYTGGAISSQSSVRVEFTQDLPLVELGSEVKEKLFDFSPSVKGKTYWVNNRCIEFVPDSGQLKQGVLYNADFELGKVLDVKKELKTFSFSFRTLQQTFALETSSYFVTAANPGVASVKGKINFSDKTNLEAVRKILIVDMEGDDSFSLNIEPGDNPQSFLFSIENIKRGKEDRVLRIKGNGKPAGIDFSTEEEILIPALEPFKYLSASQINQPENGIEIIFSDPVSQTQDLQGLIEIPEITNYVYQVDGNRVKIFFEKNTLQTITLKIDKSVQNTAGKSLGSSSTLSIAIESLKPQIEFSNAGTILPDAKNLLLPFKAVNLWAVDLKIIRIYEKNVLMFMQSNTLSSSSELRRSGRLIYKKTIRLDNDPTKKLDQWNSFSFDLSKIINQEPGAIYRIELSFNQSYSTYSCDGQTMPKAQVEGLTSISSDELTDEEQAIWDQPYAYYWAGSDIDWDEYNWQDRDDPCKPSYYMLSENTRTGCNVFASNLGIIVKGNTSNKLWISVNNILDTNPVKGVDVTAYNYQLQPIGKAQTDNDGFAVIECKGKPFILMAEQGTEKGYLRLVDGEEKSLSRFDVGGKETQKGLKGYVFGERGVWRPGDTLHISFIMEDKAKSIPQDHPVALEIYNPKGQFYAKQVSTKGINGFYSFNVPTSSDDITGLWNAYVKVGGATFHKSLHIETVKPNRLKINLQFPGDKIEQSQENIPVSLSSNWLTGSPARELKATVEMSLSKVKTQFSGYDKYVFNNPSSAFYVENMQIFNGTLNGEGKVNFNFKVPSATNAPGMLQANLISRVFEPGGDISTYVQSMPFSPFTSYVGLKVNQKDNEEYIETDKSYTFDIVTLNSDGKPINRQNLDYKVYKLNWRWWWESNSESFDSYINNSSIEPVFSETLSTVGGKTSVKFQIDYPEWGRYLVYVKDKESGHATGQAIYVDWPSWRGRSAKEDPSGITMLSFSTDKKSYEVGEQVTVIIPAAAKGKALVALENGSSVISRSWVDVSDQGDTKYTFKVTEDMSPNFYIHISLLQPHEQTVNNLPIRMYGVVPVLVTNKNSKLYPEITMPASLQPEKEFTVSVKEKSGRPMTYTLAIVDEGLLDLTAFKTPSPWDEFYAREALSIKTWDMYDYVIGAYGSKFSSLFSIGGDESLKNGNTKANRFKPVVKFIGPFSLKKGATDTHKITLPMYVGSVRTMVIAAQEGAYGNAEKTVPVKSPLMILPTLPRVVSAGEEILLPVNVFAMENNVKDVTVKVETSGLTKIADGASKSLKFSKVGDQMAYFTLKVGTTTGVEQIKVAASGNGQTASETIEIQVRNPNPVIITSVNKLINPSKEESFAYELLDKSNENWVKMEISRIPSVDLNRRFDYLESYEHCCSEQLVSKAFPLLYVDQFKNLNEKESETVKKNVREAIRLLYARQMQNGEFMYWPGSSYSYPWISSYVGHFLCEASKKGFDVNQQVLSKWKSAQRRMAQSWTVEHPAKSRYSYYQFDLDQAYRLYTLALSGSPELGAMNRLKEMKNISSQGKWRLAAAYAILGNKKAANEMIFNVSNTVDNYDLNNSTFGSSYRDEAMILETMVLLGEIEKAFQQAQLVSKNLSSEYYFSTQTTAYSLLAMGKLAEKMNKGMLEAEWSVNGQSQKTVKSAKAIDQLDIPANVLSGNVKVKNIGKGDLFVSLTSKSKPVNDTLPEVANNLRLSVTYTDLNGSPIDISEIKQGTDFIASVRVSNISGNSDYNDIALTHIIPSGWEIFNERMMGDNTGSGTNQNYTYKDIRDDRVFTYFDLYRSQSKVFTVRLQAAYVGKYILPAVQCEAMYDTQAQARTQSRWVEVVK